jgi:methylthioribose-1-phosphate isomerase
MLIQAIARVGNAVRLLDQTKLPTEVLYKELTDYRDVITSIKKLEVRGAPAIGIAAAYALAMAVGRQNDSSPATLRRLADEIMAARPTAVNLMWAVDRSVGKAEKQRPLTVEQLAALLWSEAEAIHNEDRELCRRIGEYGATLIHDGDNILTHCNTGALATGGIGTALGAIYTAYQQGKRIAVYADETRPLLQGARLTAWELKQAGIDVTLIADNMAGMLMKQGKLSSCIVGADRIAKNGDTANKIGTYSIAVLAAHHNIPFYVAAPYSTFDDNTPNGDAIVIEERAGVEITNSFGKQIAPDGVKVYNPAFDVTPFELITGYITDRGIRPGGRAKN